MIRSLPALLLAWLPLAASGAGAVSAASIQWTELAALPDKLGVASPFVGTHKGALLVAGGANFPGKPPWEGGTKVWHDTVFVLEKPDGAWKTAGKLPRPLGYGVSLSTEDGVVCIGGSDAQRHYADVFLLRWENGELKTSPLPSLPKPCANFSGALLGNTIYVAGGIETPTATNALKTFWSLDLATARPQWRELESWPGPARMLAVAAVQDKSFFLVSGAELSGDAQGKPMRRYLNDAYRYQPGRGWKRVTDLPRPAVAAPTPAPALGQSTFLVMGGDDGSLVNFQPLDRHPGFPKTILAYHTITDAWKPLGEMPAAHVTTTLARWNGGWVVPSGEVRPGVRSPAVWKLQASFQKAAFGWLNYSMVLLYLLGMVWIGCVCSKKNKSTNDFFRGGQRIPWWAAGLSIFATMLSSITFMAIPAADYTDGWNLFLANSYILITPLVVFVYLPFYRRLNVTSAYEYLERRFNAATRLAGSTSWTASSPLSVSPASTSITRTKCSLRPSPSWSKPKSSRQPIRNTPPGFTSPAAASFMPEHSWQSATSWPAGRSASPRTRNWSSASAPNGRISAKHVHLPRMGRLLQTHGKRHPSRRPAPRCADQQEDAEGLRWLGSELMMP